MTAIGHVFQWGERVRKETVSTRREAAGLVGKQPRSEQETMALLESLGVPVIPSPIVASRAEAVQTARELHAPVALKVASPDIRHKTDVGGVELNVFGDHAVAAAYDGIHERVASALPSARIDGVAISPMRFSGVELFVGTLRDPQWGHVIALGLGGIWVEAMNDTSLRMLPVTSVDVEEMFAELRGAKLLDGFRGSPAIDREAVAKVIAAIGDAALTLGPGLVSLEINPLLVNGSDIEALDALAVWEDEIAVNEEV